MEWWKKTIVYECYPKSFYDTKNQGIGTIKGITSKLDYLKSIGIGALWLTPMYKSPNIDNGYDVTDYYQIDPQYGTMEDMDELIYEAKKRGIRIVMDLVFNHSSDQCEWFIESRKSKYNPKSDWYVWADPKDDGSEPTNWRSLFGGSAWQWCKERKQHYLHTFAKEQPDLNWENKNLKKALYDVANFWVDKGIGGFRIDAISYIKKPDIFTDGEIDGNDGMSDINRICRNQEGILDFLKEFKRNVREGKDIFLVGEANGVDPKELKNWVGKNGVFDMVIEFTHTSPEFPEQEKWCEPYKWTLKEFKRNINGYQYAVNDEGWMPIYFENHDKPRLVDHYFLKGYDKKKAAKVMAVLQMCLRGTPFVYQGQEIGMTNISFEDISYYDDISSHTQYETALSEGYSKKEALEAIHRFSRDNARTPMQWNDSEYAGFSKVKPWLTINDNYKEINVEAQEKDPTSVMSFYRKLVEVRNNHQTLIDGKFVSYEDQQDDVYIFDRVNKEETVRILLNFTDQEVTVNENYEDGMNIILSTEEDHIKGKLKPLEALILSKRQ